jgi:DNA-binding transcriptional MerR regulator
VDDETYKLDELAEQAGISGRTVRYYVQRGLLPAPAFRGKDTAYTRAHLVRLRAIKKLQERFFPLDAIQAELEGKGLAELEQIALHAPPPHAPPRARRAASDAPSARLTRWPLAPGLELTLSDGASDDAQELAERIRELVCQKQGGWSK